MQARKRDFHWGFLKIWAHLVFFFQAIYSDPKQLQDCSKAQNLISVYPILEAKLPYKRFCPSVTKLLTYSFTLRLVLYPN